MGNEESCIQFLFEERLLKTNKNCSMCNKPMSIQKCSDRKYPYLQCKQGHTKVTISCASGTWFEKTKLSPIQVMLLTHCFAVNNTYKQTITDASVGNSKLSKTTVSDWFSFCREVCMISMCNKITNSKIGGPGHIVEIDECKIGRRKYNRGRLVEGNWILGMIDRNTREVRMAVCPGNRRDATTLYDLVSQHVEPTSTIYTDCWKGYNGLLAGGFSEHLTVNHSENFVDQITGAHTNTIEAQWRTLRRTLARGGIRQKNIDVHLCEFLWRKDCNSRNADPFQQLIEDIREIYPVD
jgi:hypothetical protein